MNGSSSGNYPTISVAPPVNYGDISVDGGPQDAYGDVSVYRYDSGNPPVYGDISASDGGSDAYGTIAVDGTTRPSDSAAD